MKKLVIATHNAHKTQEIAAVLSGTYEVVDLNAYPEIPPADETGTTFEENATIKAVEASRALEGMVLSDDSGLEVDALDGEPGIYSSRYSGEGATDASNREKLKAELLAKTNAGTSPGRFRCCMVLALGGEKIAAFHGAVEGTLHPQEQGEGGFGYDPLFVPEGHDKTFAEIPEGEKNSMSHRARALEKAVAWLGRSGA